MLPALVLMIVFGISHSILAGHSFKQAFRARCGERVYQGVYRLFYNIVAVISLAPVAYLLAFHPGAEVWRIPSGWRPVLFIIQGIGLIGFVLSLLQIDLWRFAGISQIIAYLKGDDLPLPDELLQTRGVYALVRHPLYLFSLMLIWPVQTMNAMYLGFCLGATVYFIVGSLYEERRLAVAFGQPYEEYQRRVAWLIPGVRWPPTVNKA